MNFNDTIGIYENALSKEQCKELIKYYDDNSSDHFQGITNAGDDLTVKNSTDLMLWQGDEMDMLCDVSNQHINKYIETYKDAVNFVMENIQHTYPHDNIEFEFVEEHPILDEPKIDKHIFMVETRGERERLQ